MSYYAGWFKENMQAVPCGDVGACSFCCLRNLDRMKFCYKIRCSDSSSGKTVYWTSPKHTREILMGQPPLDMIDWFNHVPIEYARDVSLDVLKCALNNDNQK